MKKDIKLTLITGGSSGIGLALARQLVSQGHDVCLLARDQERLKNAQEEITKLRVRDGQIITTISCDIREYDSLAKELQHFIDKFGLPDLVVNSAGVTYPGYFQNIDVEIFHWLMDINFYGTLHVLKYLIPKMIERGSGKIVNISSQAGFVGVFGYTGYSASKFAVRGFSDVLRAEMKPYGIQVFIVFPPDTKTPQLSFEEPLKPVETKELSAMSKALSADEVATTILKGIQKGRYVIIPGLEGKLILRLTNLLGNLTYPLKDWLVRQAQKKIK